MVGERPANPGTLDRPAPERDHGRGSADLPGERVESRDDQPLFAAAELGLTLPLEERRDGLAELPLEQLVGVDHPEPKALRDGVRRPRLARSHEPDENDPVVRAGSRRSYLRHPMRSL